MIAYVIYDAHLHGQLLYIILYIDLEGKVPLEQCLLFLVSTFLTSTPRLVSRLFLCCSAVFPGILPSSAPHKSIEYFKLTSIIYISPCSVALRLQLFVMFWCTSSTVTLGSNIFLAASILSYKGATFGMHGMYCHY